MIEIPRERAGRTGQGEEEKCGNEDRLSPHAVRHDAEEGRQEDAGEGEGRD